MLNLCICTGPSALTVNVTKNNESLSSVVQWDAVDGSLATNYIVTWTSETDPTQSVTTTMETSYTITGLTLDTVYTITVAAVNMCGSGPAFSTSIAFHTGTYVSLSLAIVCSCSPCQSFPLNNFRCKRARTKKFILP